MDVLDSSNLASAAMSFHARRQLQGLPPLTPEQLAEIDFANKSTLTTLVWSVSGLVMGLICVIVPMRLIIRQRTTGRILLDDWLVILASLFTLVVCAMAVAATRHGLGQHIWNLNFATILDELRNCVQLMFVGNVFYALAIAFTKLSIISSYLHIFSPRGAIRWVLYGTGGVTVGLLVASVPATIFQCRPVAAAWDFSLPQDNCYAFVNFLYASTAINISTDLILCTAPIPLLWELRLPARQKLLISFLFVLGGFACVASIIRIAYLHTLDGPIDVTYNLVSSLLWTIAECAIGILCVSIPSLRPLLARFFPGLFKSQWTTHGGATGTNKSSASSHRRPGGPGSKLSGPRVDDVPIELVSGSRPRGDSWVKLADPEAQADSVWDRGAGLDPPAAAARMPGKKGIRESRGVSAWDHD